MLARTRRTVILGTVTTPHTHVISDVFGLQTALDGKVALADLASLADLVDTKASQEDLDDLAAVVATKAADADLDALEAVVATKASASSVSTLASDVADRAYRSDLHDTAEIDVSVDGSGYVTFDLKTGAIALSKLANLAGLSVIGRAANSGGVPAAITAANDGEVLLRNGASIGFGTLIAASFANNTIVAARLAVTGQWKLFGRATASAGAGEEISSSSDVFTLLGKADLAAMKTYFDITDPVHKSGNENIDGTKRFIATGAVKAPVGTQAQRPGSPEVGLLRYNTDTGYFEGYAAAGWGPIGGGLGASIVRGAVDATAAQTVVPVAGGYTPNALDVFVNGVRMQTADVTISSGTNIVFAAGLALNDRVEWSGYLGIQNLTAINTRVYQRFPVSSPTSTFTVTSGYSVGFIDVFHNGIKLDPSSDYTASNGVDVVTASNVTGGVVEVVGYNQLSAISSFLFSNTGLRVYDTDSSHYLRIKPGSDLTANRTLTVLTGDQDRQIDLTTSPIDVNNRLHNFAFEISKRTLGGTFSDGAYAFDRYVILTQSNPVTVSQLTDPETGFLFAQRISQSNASAQRVGFAQIIESKDIRDLRSKVATMIARLRLSTSANLRAAVVEWTGTADVLAKDLINDWTSTSYTAGGFFTSTTRNVVAVSPSIAMTAATWKWMDALTGSAFNASMNNVVVVVWSEATLAQNVTLDCSYIGLWEGAYATPGAIRPNERVFCDRFLQWGGYDIGRVYTTSVVEIPIKHRGLRTNLPTLIAVTNLEVAQLGIGFSTPSSPVMAHVFTGTADASFINSQNYSGLTVGNAVMFTSAAAILLSSELGT